MAAHLWCASNADYYLIFGVGHINRSLSVQYGRTDGRGRHNHVCVLAQIALGFHRWRTPIVDLQMSRIMAIAVVVVATTADVIK